MMKLIGVLLTLGMFAACAEDAPLLTENSAALCTTACAGLEGQDHSDCIAEECGPTGGGGDGGGGGTGGGGGQIGEVCNRLGTEPCDSSGGTRTVDFCCDGYFQCRYRYGECWPDPI